MRSSIADSHLQFLGARSRTNRQGERIVELMYDEIQVHGFFPIDVGIADRQFFAVFTKYIDLSLELGQIPRRSLHMFFSNKEKQIVAVDSMLRLKQEVPDEQIRPVSCAL